MTKSSGSVLAVQPDSQVADQCSDQLGDIFTLAEDYRYELQTDVRNGHKVPRTVEVYMTGVQLLVDFLVLDGRPTNVADVTPSDCAQWIRHLQRQGKKPATIASRFVIVKGFFAWLVAQREIPVNPMAGMKAPHIPESTSEDVLSPDQIKAMLATCNGTDFVSVRNNAMLRLFSATGVRLDELTQLQYNPNADYSPNTTAYLDLESNVIHVLGKGCGRGKRPRSIPFDDETATALRQYRRARARHLVARHTASDALWVTERSAAKLGTTGVTNVVRTAASRAGLGSVHPHQLRHSCADRLMRLVDKGLLSEGDVMRIMGWRNRAMLDRYARNTQVERAHNAYKRVGMGAY